MEQANMMPNNGMGNNINMAMNSMQRPQNGNQMQQIHAMVMEHLRSHLSQIPQDWQQTFDIRERANKIMQMITQLRQLENNVQKCINIAESWEIKIITSCPSKESYFAEWDRKLGEITRKREAHVAQAGLSMPQQNNMGNMHNMNMQQNGGMNGMNGMGGMNMNFNGMGGMNMPNGGMGMPGQMNMGQQGGFPQQLQRQMQPSPMPPQNQPPQNGSINPSALTNNPQMSNMNHMQNQMSQQTPQQRQQHQQNLNPGQGGPPNGPSENEVKAFAKRMFDTTSEQQKNQLRAQFLSTMGEQQKQQIQQRGIDPLNHFYLKRARDQLLKQRAQNGGMAGMGNSMQPDPSQSGQPNIDFSSLMGQQANAIKSQESGGEVVPASNNNNGAGQGGNNQQQMMNFGQNGGNNANMATNMHFAAMQDKQKREQMARKNQMAQQQAMAQQNQLRGQPGGLNAPNALNGGQVNSPAMNMNMLNRPTFPPGQTTPSTPHQNQNMQNHPPQTPSTGANQLQQHHQNMINQSGMGQDVLQPQQRQFMDNLPLEARQKLATLPPEQVSALLTKFAQQRGAMMPPGGQPNGQGMGMGMGSQPMQNQHSMGGMGNAVPGFNSQPPLNQQQQQQQGHMDPQAGLQQKLQQQQQAQLRQKAMDSRPYPKQVLATLSLTVPEHVNSWGRLRQHIAQNQSVLPQGLMEKLGAMQNQWFDTHPDELKLAIENIKRMIMAQNSAQRQAQAGQGQPQMGPHGMPMPNGQAPQAQMVAPPAQMQQHPHNQQPGDIQITPENIAMVRARMGNNAKNLTDDQLRELLLKQRRNRQGTQGNQANQANPANPANQAMQQNLRNAQMSAQQMQQAQQAMAGNQQGNQQGGQRPQQGQGQKRGNSDDVVEIPNPNAPNSQSVPQLQQNQQQRGPQMPPGLKSKEEVMAMPHDQRQAYMRKIHEMQALRKAQVGLGANPQQTQNAPTAPQMQQPPQQVAQPAGVPDPENAARMQRLKVIYQEVSASTQKGPPVQLDQKSTQQAQELLKKLFPIAMTLDKTLIAGHKRFGEDKVREAIKIKHTIMQNAADPTGRIRDYLSVSLETLKRFEHFVGSYLQELRKQQHAQNAAKAGQQDTPQQSQDAAQAASQQQVQAKPPQQKQAAPAASQKAQAQPPLNRKNSSQHARKASQNKAPPAPTENKTFDWASPTPHGVPKYDPGRTELTADKLKFPPQKKRKTTDSQDSTPAAQTGTPGAAGASPQILGGPKRESPDQMRKPAPQPPAEPEKPRFNCDDPFCMSSIQGFGSEEALKKHVEDEHKPIEDPFKFLVDTVDESLKSMGVDKDDKPLPAKAKTQTLRRPPPAAQRIVDRKAAGSLTPALKAESATPATPGSAGKRGGLATPAGAKKAEVESKPQEEKTLYDTLVEQLGTDQPADKAHKPPTSEPAVAAPTNDPFLSSISDIFNTDNRTELDMDDWSAIDFNDISSVGLPRDPALAVPFSDTDSNPELTPASSTISGAADKDKEPNLLTISEAERLNVVFSWDPAGNGDTAVPERLKKMVLDEEQAKEGGEKKDPLDWSEDGMEWEELLGKGSGLGDDDGGFEAVFGVPRDMVGGL